MRNIYARNTLRGALKRGAQFKCFACLALNTLLYITLTMILCENMKPIEHVLLPNAYFLTGCAHVNTLI